MEHRRQRRFTAVCPRSMPTGTPVGRMAVALITAGVGPQTMAEALNAADVDIAPMGPALIHALRNRWEQGEAMRVTDPDVFRIGLTLPGGNWHAPLLDIAEHACAATTVPELAHDALAYLGRHASGEQMGQTVGRLRDDLLAAAPHDDLVFDACCEELSNRFERRAAAAAVRARVWSSCLPAARHQLEEAAIRMGDTHPQAIDVVATGGFDSRDGRIAVSEAGRRAWFIACQDHAIALAHSHVLAEMTQQAGRQNPFTPFYEECLCSLAGVCAESPAAFRRHVDVFVAGIADERLSRPSRDTCMVAVAAAAAGGA